MKLLTIQKILWQGSSLSVRIPHTLFRRKRGATRLWCIIITWSSKSSHHWPFRYTCNSVEKHADDAEHHLPANAVQPDTTAKSISLFLLLACWTLIWEWDLFLIPTCITMGWDQIHSIVISSGLVAGVCMVSRAKLHEPSNPQWHNEAKLGESTESEQVRAINFNWV
jgi:hypothetical protein